jgi:four helix bundle protein
VPYRGYFTGKSITSKASTTSTTRMGYTRIIMYQRISGYRNLIVWQEAKALTILVYKLTENLPRSEDFGLKSQMRRATVSVMSQLAEGWMRRSKKDKLRYLEIAEGSLMEVESQSEITFAVSYWTKESYKQFDKQRSKVSFLLQKYIEKIKDSPQL